jgi:hypothetical protein
MKNKKQQRRFDKILEDLCMVSAELALEAINAKDRTDGHQADLYANAQILVNVAIELIDPGCNPRYVVTIREAQHG